MKIVGEGSMVEDGGLDVVNCGEDSVAKILGDTILFNVVFKRSLEVMG